MIEILDWVNIGTAVITLATAIIKVTPTQEDDKILAKLLKFIDLFAINTKK